METRSEDVSIRAGTILWKRDLVVCTCAHPPDQTIEIRLIVEGVEVDFAVFTDIDLASAYAITRMHAYKATA